MKGFAQLLGGFLLEYVPRRRNLSENTAKSYRDSFVLLLGWLLAIVPGGGWLLLGGRIPFAAFLALLVVLFGGLSILALAWLKKSGAKRFETLS